MHSAPSAASAASAASPAHLVVIDGPEKGRKYPLDGELFTVGRQDANDLQVLEAAVSRRHCEIRRADGAFELHDAGSVHGTFVNGTPVGRHVLAHGDHVQIGSAGLLFLHESSPDPEPGDHDALTAAGTVERSSEEIAQLLRGRGRSSTDGDGLLLEIAGATQELRDPRALVERLLDRVAEALGADHGAVLSFESGEATASRGDGVPAPSRTVLGRIEDERVALVWDDVTRGDGLPQSESLRDAEIRSLLAAPLAGRRDLHGVLYLQSSRIGAFTEARLELAAVAASLVGLALDTARAFEDLRRENRRLRGGAEHGLVGEGPAMERLLDFIGRVAPVDSTVLLLGESGTGKELAASALHRASSRSGGPFVAVNCATLSETLLESELFGHERGAFTGAMARKIGRFEAADGGTLFLDEVAEMPPGLQARLLRALQERTFERVGGERAIEVDVRVIAATHRDLEQAIRQGTFREDLFYRLNVIAYTLPPLRERRQDVPLLARHFIRRHGERLNRTGVGLDPKALRLLVAYDWPGNVRQLSNAIERALVLGDGERIRPEDLPEELLDRPEAEEVELGDYQATLTETKKRLLTTALAETGGNAAEAARRLGLHPNSFRRLMRRLGLRDES